MYSVSIPDGYTEITLEQFRKYILKKDEERIEIPVKKSKKEKKKGFIKFNVERL